MESTTSTTGAIGATGNGNGRFTPPPPGTRSAEQIRNDIETQRTELSRSVEALRTRWVEVTDVGAQLRKHRGKLIAGAVVAGFVVGGVLALRRR
jgi:Protein of unknown function (DUF3618)